MGRGFLGCVEFLYGVLKLLNFKVFSPFISEKVAQRELDNLSGFPVLTMP